MRPSKEERQVLCVQLRHADCTWAQALGSAGWKIHFAASLSTAHRLIQDNQFHVGIMAPAKLDEDACAELSDFLRAHASLEWVGVFGSATLAGFSCRDLIVEHLFDHHTVPVDNEFLAMTVGHAYGHATLRQEVCNAGSSKSDTGIIGNSPATKELIGKIRRVAKVDAPVLVLGESGSGKELTAQAIHRCSGRAKGPFVPVNCGAIQASLIQSELFGHTKGAFTGADKEGRGLIESASGGTIFLDEIGDLSLDLQINLLRFLQEKTINRVGSTKSIHVDARVIAATHVDLEKAVAAGSFREDLFYRLNVVPLRVPALHERLSDVESLAQYFFDQFANERAAQLKGFSQRAVLAMSKHDWPGNVRELINRVRRAVVMAEGRLVTPEDLGLGDKEQTHVWDALGEARLLAERNAISTTLQQVGRNVTQAAKQLGVSRMTLYRLMTKHGIWQDLRG